MERLNFYNNDVEVNNAIHKSMEIFMVIKNTILKMDGKVIGLENKKLLALLLGIEYTDNNVSRKLKELLYNYRIIVHTEERTQEDCMQIYNEYFKDTIDSFELETDFRIEELMLKLLNTEFITYLHERNNYPINSLRIKLSEDLRTKKLIKTLQK